MRIKMAGAYWLYEFEEAVDCIVQVLKANGVNELRSISIYLQPFSDGEHIEFGDQETGVPFQILRYRGRRHRPFQVTSPRLQPEQDALPIATAIPIFDRSRPRGNIEQFIGLLEGQGANDDTQAFAAEQVLKNAELIAVSIPSICEFVEILRQTYALEPSAVATAVRSLIDAANVAVDRSAVAAGLAIMGSGGKFVEGIAAFEGQRLGGQRFVSFDHESVARIERIMAHYR